MIPYRSKFSEAKLQESYDLDAFNAFLEKEVPGFGGPGPDDKQKANEYFKQMIKTLESYIEGNNEDAKAELPRKTRPHWYYNESSSLDELKKDWQAGRIHLKNGKFVGDPKFELGKYNSLSAQDKESFHKFIKENPDQYTVTGD